MDNAWANQFASVLTETLSALRQLIGKAPLAMLAIDCHPWNGGLYLALLKQSELDADSELATPAEMAAWELYDCGATLDEWSPSAALATKMKAACDSADDTNVVAEDCFKACVDALKASSVQDVIRRFVLSEGFRISCAHPDTDHEFVV